MSQMSADPLRYVALSEVLPVDPAALRSARRGEFESELSRAQQRRDSQSPPEPPISQCDPADAAAHSRRRRNEATATPGPPPDRPTQSSTNDDRLADEEEAEGAERAEASTPIEAEDQSAALVDGNAVVIDAEEVIKAPNAEAAPEVVPEVALAQPEGQHSPTETDAVDGTIPAQRDAAQSAVAATPLGGAAEHAQTSVEVRLQGVASPVAAAAALKQDNRTKAEAAEEAADSGEQQRERPIEQKSARAGSREAEIDIEALRAPTGDALNPRRAGDAASGAGGLRRSGAGADPRIGGARRARAAEQPAVANLPTAQAVAADAPVESPATLAPTAAATATHTASAVSTSQPAPLPTFVVSEAASAVVGVRQGPARTAPAANAAEETSGREPGAGIDRARFVQRVAGAFRSLSEQNNTLRLKLSPPELGSLRIEITVRNGQMSARLEAETSEARNLLLDHLPALRERLAGQEIKIQQFHVEVADRQPGGGTHHAGQDESRRREARAASVHGPARGNPTPPIVEAAPQSRLGGDGRLNVIV